MEWGKFKLGELFDIQSTLSFNKESLVPGNKYDYITRTSQNQGILQETGFVNEENINSAGNWSLGLLQMDFFYRHKPWYAGQFVRKISPKIEIKNNSILFFSVILNQQKNKLLSVLVRDIDKTFNNLEIQLPTINGEIDFIFMESFIEEIEKERIERLNNYLEITGLKDCDLTEKEKEVLEDFESGKVEWGEFKLGELFEKIKVKSLKYKTSELPNEANNEYNLPALTAGIINQGLNNFVPKENATILKNVISISANGANTGATFYQSKEFTVLQDSYAIKYIYNDYILNNNKYLYLTSIISNTIYGKYDWSNKAGWEKIKNHIILLPIKNNQPDYEIMETLISAVQKLVIKDVVGYVEKEGLLI